MEDINLSRNFDIQELIDKWTDRLKMSGNFTDSDCEELKSHLLDSVDQLKKTGLNEEEAFWVAKKRLGETDNWQDEFKEMNKGFIQMRMSVALLAGILTYFLIYYFLLFTSKALFIGIIYLGDSDFQQAVQWIKSYLIACHFLILLFLTSIYLIEKKIIRIIEQIKLPPSRVVVLFVVTVTFAIAEEVLIPLLNRIAKANFNLKDYLYDVFIYFDYSLPLIFCIAFIILYQKYFKKTKISF
jgi:hypothetical protein